MMPIRAMLLLACSITLAAGAAAIAKAHDASNGVLPAAAEINISSSSPVSTSQEAGSAKIVQEPAHHPEGPETSKYVLGPDDVIAIRALDAEEIGNAPIRIDPGGYISLPMLGRLYVAGLSTERLESVLKTRLKTYIQEPVVAVTVVEYRSQPVSILGSVARPGIHQLEGRKTLIEILSLAGGLLPDAGYTVKITRRAEWGPIPLSSATWDPSGNFSIADVKLRGIMEASSPEDNILIKPNDIIAVPRGAIVYVLGDVRKPGGFVLNERESISTLQALAMAEGLLRTSAPQNSKIIRPNVNTKSTEILIDLRGILNGKQSDVELMPDDILLIPGSASKSALARFFDAAVSAATSASIYRGVY